MRVRFRVCDPHLDALQGLELLVIPVAGDVRPLRGLGGACDWELNGELSRALQDERFTGARGDRLLIHTDGRLPVRFVLLLGIGRAAAFGHGELVPFFRALARVLHGAGAGAFGIALHELESASHDRGVVSAALLAGLLAGFGADDVELWLLEGGEQAAQVGLDLAHAAEHLDQVSLVPLSAR